MCTIMATTGSLTTLPEFEEAFARTKYRGPDDTRLINTAEQTVMLSAEDDYGIPATCRRGIMGFHRLSIMGLTPEGMQPFMKDGCSVICNGELYGFEKMKKELEAKGYTFRSGSDCELLLPLWFEHGTEMFDLLDAEFACVIYDGRLASGRYITATTGKDASHSQASPRVSLGSATGSCLSLRGVTGETGDSQDTAI